MPPEIIDVNGLLSKSIKLVLDAGWGLGLYKAWGSEPTGFGWSCGWYF